MGSLASIHIKSRWVTNFSQYPSFVMGVDQLHPTNKMCTKICFLKHILHTFPILMIEHFFCIRKKSSNCPLPAWSKSMMFIICLIFPHNEDYVLCCAQTEKVADQFYLYVYSYFTKHNYNFKIKLLEKHIFLFVFSMNIKNLFMAHYVLKYEAVLYVWFLRSLCTKDSFRIKMICMYKKMGFLLFKQTMRCVSCVSIVYTN